MTFSERVPPQNLEAEQSVLGACLVEPEALPIVRRLIDASDFYSEKHRDIYEAIANLIDRREPVDLITVQEELKKVHRFERIGGMAYLTALMNMVPTTANVGAYATIVRDKADIRRLQIAARKVVDECYTAQNAEEIKTFAISEVQNAVFGRESSILRPMGQALVEYVEQSMNDVQEGKSGRNSVPTMFKRQDSVIPLMRGEVTVVPSPSSMGKTTWMFNLLFGTAKLGEPTCGFSLEMSNRQILQKTLANVARVNTLLVRHNALDQQEWSRAYTAAAEMMGWPLYYGIRPRMKFADIRLEVLAFKARHGKVSLVCIDYWQIIGDRPGRDERKDEMLGRLIEDAKALAIECDCHIVVLAQATINSAKVVPTLEDVKESRAIVASADNVLFLTRPIEFGELKLKLPSMDEKRWIETTCNATDPTMYGKRRGVPMFQDVMLGIQGKQRMGPKALVPYFIDLATGRMSDLFEPWPWDNAKQAGYHWPDGVEGGGQL